MNKNYKEAEETYKKTLILDPKLPFVRVELSKLYARTGRYDDAETQLKKMVANSTSKHNSLNILGQFYESAKKWKKAEESYQEAVKIAPEDSVGPLMALSGFYARRNSYDSALKTMKKAASQRGEDDNIQLAIANLHFEFKHFTEAEKTIDTLLERQKRETHRKTC